MIYADANMIIRLIEGTAEVRAPLEGRLQPFKGSRQFLATSRLSRLECRVKPLRELNEDLLRLYDTFFRAGEVVVVEITAEVVEKATEIRARLDLKTPDAIHMASAILCGASVFLTADKGFTRCKEIQVEVV